MLSGRAPAAKLRLGVRGWGGRVPTDVFGAGAAAWSRMESTAPQSNGCYSFISFLIAPTSPAGTISTPAHVTRP